MSTTPESKRIQMAATRSARVWRWGMLPLGMLFSWGTARAEDPAEEWESDAVLGPFDCPSKEVFAIRQEPEPLPSDVMPTTESMERTSVAASYSSFSSTSEQGARIAYGAPSLRLTRHQALPGCESPGLFRAGASMSRLTKGAAEGQDALAWAVGLGALLKLPGWDPRFKWMANLDVEFGGGVGFASELIPSALDDVADAAVSPAVAFSVFPVSWLLRLDGHTRYRQLLGAGGAQRGLVDLGMSLDVGGYLWWPLHDVRLGYQYSTAVVGGDFHSHEVRLSAWVDNWISGDGRLALGGIIEMSRWDFSRTARAVHLRMDFVHY